MWEAGLIPSFLPQDGERIRFNSDGVAMLNSRISINGDGTLTIEEANISDSGEYTCRAENGNGKPVVASATVDVIKKTEVLQKPEHAMFRAGKDITFDCLVKVCNSLLR